MDSKSRLIFFSLSLASDPEMPVWTDSPDPQNPLSLMVPSSVYTGEQTIQIGIDNLAQDVEAVVCFYKDDEVYASEFVTGTGSTVTANIDCTPDTPGDILVTVTAKNYLPVETEIPVTYNPAVHLYAYNITIDDDDVSPSYGNDDGLVDAGESISLSVILKNNGLTGAMGVNGILSTTSDYVTITQSQSNYGNIASLGTGTSATPYVIEIDNDAPDQFFAVFELNITDGQSNNYEDEIYLEIHAPVLNLNGTSIFTTSGEENVIDPGDHVEVTFELHNGGTGMATGVTGELISESPYIEEITEPDQPFGDILSHDSGSNPNPFEFDVYGNYSGQTIEMVLTLTDDFGNEWEIPFNFDSLPDMSDLNFTSTNTNIMVYWDPVPGAYGYNVYRSDSNDGDYVKLNDQIITGFSGYTDAGLEALTIYYYKACCVSQYGMEGTLTDPALKAWTTLPYHPDWPLKEIDVDFFGARTEGSPMTEDFDVDGTKEIYFTSSAGPGDAYDHGGIFGFYHDMEEIYDIDQNNTTYSGFYHFNGAGSRATPAIGDLDNDHILEIVTTTQGDNNSFDRRKLFIHSTVDADNPPDGNPDLIGTRDIYGPDFKGAVLSDIDYDEILEIIVKSGWGDSIYVLKYANGSLSNYPGWPKKFPGKEFGMPVAVNLDNIGDKELIFDFDNGGNVNAGIYAFKSNGDSFLPGTNGVFYQNGPSPEVYDRMDSPPTIIDINNDGYDEIICVSGRYNSGNPQGRVFILDRTGNTIQGWGYDSHVISIMNTGYANILWLPVTCVGDINGNGDIEVIIADHDTIHIWNADSSNFIDPIYVQGLQAKFIAPLIADVDDDDDMEIIVASNDPVGAIYAFNIDGSKVLDWPLSAKGVFATPCIDDIDNDGKNEIIATSGSDIYVWDTEGDADKTEWGKYRHDSYNSGIYGNFCPYYANSPVEIDENTEWTKNYTLQSDVIIEDGGTLTIYSHVAMPENGKITVEVGGQLILDGGTLTNACTGPWQGVEVQGDPREEQIPNSNQGMISIVHEGTIENAKIGVTVIDGGIVLADSANFINNHIAVEFRQYDEENISLFSFCEFKSNENCLPKAPPLNFVTLTDVNGVEFKACSFKNTWDSDYGELVERGNGIFSINSSFYVDYECRNSTVPCGDYQYNLFQGLNYGIYAIDIGYDNSIVVSHTEFMENIKGLYLSGYQNGIEVTSNDFNLCNTILNINSYGMYLDQCTGYHVEDNRFHNESVVGDIPGLYINNSGTEDNLIYNNRFDTLNYAIIAHNINRDDSQEKGLCIKCNDFRSDTYDISVTVSAPLVNEDYGIAEYQGSMDQSDDAPAGNTFTEHGSHDWDIYNEGNNIEYIHHLVSSTPLKVKPDPNKISENVNTKENKSANYDKEKSCPSMLFCGGGDKENLKSLLAVAETNIQAIQAELTELVDGGNTEAMNTDVLTSIPDEALEIHDQLLSESPYLSDTVMKSAISKENVLPNAMIRDVLVANPQAAKSEDVLTELDNRWDPMPDDMMDEIMAGKDSLGAKEILDSKLAKYSLDRSNAFHTLVRLYKNDTTDASAKDSLIAFLTNDEALQSKYSLTFLYQQFNDSIQADAVLNSIPDDFDLTGEQQVIHSNYMSLFGVLRALLHDSLSILELNESQINTLQLLAEDDQYVPGVFARNILLANGLSDYEEPVILPDPYKLSPINKNETKKVTTINRTTNLAIYPNPAKKYFIVEYQLEKDAMDIQIEILDMISRKVVEMTLHGQHDQVVVPVNNWHQGIYLVRLMANGRLMESRKVAVVDN